MNEINVRVLLLSNFDGGIQDFIEVTAGTTLQQFLANQFNRVSLDDVSVKLNRVPVTASDLAKSLGEGDRVTVTPKKIEGA